MAICQGDVPITTKVDEPMRDFVDETAEEVGVSRSELMRRLLDLYHQSEDGNLECPSCTQAVRIRPESVELVKMPSDEGETVEDVYKAEDIGTMRDEPTKGPNTGQGAMSPEHLSRIAILESIVEEQEQKLEFLREKMTAQEQEIAKLAQSDVSSGRVNELENEVEGSIHRIEALTAVSDLNNEGNCPRCDTELSVNQPYVDTGEPMDIECPNCGLVVGQRG